MSKEEIDECIEELYSIHKDLTEVYNNTVQKLSAVTDSNMEILGKIEDLQKEIASSVHNVKIYNNRFVVFLIAILVLILISFGWKFGNYSRAVDLHLRHTQNAYRFMLEGMMAQSKSLQRIEVLEKLKINNSKVEKNKGKLEASKNYVKK